MTALAGAQDRFSEPPASLWQRLLQGPHQGWLSVFLLAAMLMTVGVAVDDARWVGAAPLGGSQTSFLPGLFLFGGALGLILGKSRLRTGRAHILAVLLGAAVLLAMAANAISSASTILSRLRDLSDSFGLFVGDVFVLGARSTETSAFLLVIGAIAFTSGYFGAYNVFRRSRGVPAVTAIGLVLLVNMSITVKVQYAQLIVFTVAAMLLLVRLNLAQQEQGWRRRHIASSEAGGLLLRGGVTFVAFTLVGAVVLAATASSAPLQSFWRNLDDPLVSMAVALNRVVGGVTGTTRQAGGLFGSAESIRGVWESSDQKIFTAVTTDNGAYYWRGAIYDSFDGLTWTQSERSTANVPANADLLGGSPERISAGSPERRAVTARITSVSLGGGTMLAPETPLKSDRDTVVRTAGPDGPLVSIELSDAIDPGQSYTVSSAVPITNDPTKGVTANMLAAAGTDYPDWVKRYIEIEPNSVGKVGFDTANQVVSALPANLRDPYHIAFAFQTFFDSKGNFRYSTDVRGVCGRESIVDCLVVHKIGYCQHYATAMTMLLRTQGIPARFVEGYLPGKELPDKSREVDASAAHAWVEVYFPGYGWLRFDPTPGNTGNGRVATDLPAGPAVPIGPHASVPPLVGNGDIPGLQIPPEDPDRQTLPTPPAADTGVTSLVAVLALVGIGLALAFVARRRRHRPALGADQTFDRMARLASRFGYAPRPSQTAYEYAGTLAAVLPGIRAELQVVALAKVESTYARRIPTTSALAALQQAYGRIRRGLVSLVFRRRRAVGQVRSKRAGSRPKPPVR